MKYLYRPMFYKFHRFINGLSLLRVFLCVSLVALCMILLSKSQLYHVEELQSVDSPDRRYQNILVTTSILKTNINEVHPLSLIIHPKETISKLDIHSGPDTISINVSFNLNLQTVQKMAENDILLKELNMNSLKLSDSLEEKGLDYDFNARFCRCTKISQPCICCVKLTLDLLGLMKTLCCNITYMAKEKAAKISLIYGDEIKSRNDIWINTDNPPLLCFSQLIMFDSNIKKDKVSDSGELMSDILTNTTLELCLLMKNLTYNLMMEGTHRTEFKGCSNVHVRLNAIVIHVYPLGCFLASYDDSQELQIQKVVHGIP